MSTVERYVEGGEYTQPAVDALDMIAALKIPKLRKNSDPLEVFPQHDLGRAFAGIVEAYGYMTYGAGGYRQLRGSDGNERFLATYYDHGDSHEQIARAAFHAYITNVGPFDKPSYTIPITIPVESGVPIVTRNERGEYGRLSLGEKFDPKASFEEVRHLAALMSRALQGTQTGLGAFEVIQ
jgi:hypothetical protein